MVVHAIPWTSVVQSTPTFHLLSSMNTLVQLTLFYPPSTNRYWRTFRGRPVLSKEAKEFKRAVKEAGPKQDLYTGDVGVTIQLLPKLTAKGVASKVCLDIDNPIKVILDSIQGVYIENDKQVKMILAEYGEPVKDGGVIVKICKIS